MTALNPAKAKSGAADGTIGSMAVRKRIAVITIFTTVVLDIMAAGIGAPVLPDLIRRASTGTSAATALTLGALITTLTVSQFLANPVQGSISDRFGRRPVILGSNFGLSLSYLLTAGAPSIPFLFVAQIARGIFSGSLATSYAYLTDLTEPGRRAAAFGLLGAAGGLGASLAPVIGGLLGSIDPRLPFVAAAALSLVNGTFGLAFLRESLAPADRSRSERLSLNPLTNVVAVYRASPLVRFWYASALAGGLAAVSATSVLVLFLREVLDFPVRDVGLLLTAYGLGCILSQGLLLRVLAGRVGEITIMTVAFVTQIAAFLLFALDHAPAAPWIAVILLSLGSIGGPTLMAAMTRSVPAQDQGRLQGALSSIGLGAGIIGPPIFTAIFATAIARSPHAFGVDLPFLIGAGLGMTAMWAGLAGLVRARRSATPTVAEPSERGPTALGTDAATLCAEVAAP